jgi:hypothetical protein
MKWVPREELRPGRMTRDEVDIDKEERGGTEARSAETTLTIRPGGLWTKTGETLPDYFAMQC